VITLMPTGEARAMLSTGTMILEETFGRSAELERIDRFLARIASDGEAWLLCGESGVGKSFLLEATARAAASAHIRVLRGSGSEFEAHISYSCLNQLLLNVTAQIERLSPLFREPLTVALGLETGPVPDRRVVCDATVALLRLLASDGPVLAAVDDLNWVDRASAHVLSFAARRLAGARAGFIGAYRQGHEIFFNRTGLTEFFVGPLDESAAADLLDHRYPELTPGARRRVLSAARGNPLALVELPSVLNEPRRTAARQAPAVLPLSDRLQALYESRIAPLPRRTLSLLLLAVFDGSGDLRVLQAAGDCWEDLADLAPAERDGLISIDDAAARLAFRHPLIRSAVVGMSTHEQRRDAHRCLARVLIDQPERHAWHLAEAAISADENVAGLLEQAARTAAGRGDPIGAVSALVRAAELSPSDHDRARRLAEAAYTGAETTGDLADAQSIESSLGGSLSAACAAVFLMLNSDGDVETAYRLLAGAIEAGDHGYRADDPALLEAVHNLALLCWWGSRPQWWEPFYRALDRMTPAPTDLLALLRKSFPDPATTAATAAREAERILAEIPEEHVLGTGMASVYIDRLGDLRDGNWTIVHEGRASTPNRREVGALMHLCLDDFLTGDWAEGEQLADEGLDICRHYGFPFFEWYFLYNKAIFMAGRGRFDEASELADEMSRWAAPRGLRAAQLWAYHPRTLVALGQGDFERAFRNAEQISRAGALASHIPHSLWLTFDLVEAAVQTGRHEQARAHAEAMRESKVADISPRMSLIEHACSALAADDESTQPLFETALARGGGQRWRYDEARVRLAYGEWLRRTRSVSAARSQLLAASQIFQEMGADPWVARATSELRAVGERAPSGASMDAALTTQENEIALLAATGLTNKEIGGRLYVSHRTVSSHLYRIFPKLGITKRSALRDALAQLDSLH
jgi:DNA-binding CsgD family transcriptional regulator